MYLANITSLSRRNLLPAAQHFKPLAAFWRSQKTAPAPLEQDEAFRDSAKTEIEHGSKVRPFGDIPGPARTFKSMVEFYRDSNGLTKMCKLTEGLFAKYGPIYKENTLGQTQVHVMDPEDFEKVFREEGKYPRRPLIDAWVEYRKRRNHFPGVVNVDGEEWRRLRQSIAPKIMRPKTVEENIENFNAVTQDAIARLIKLKETCGPDDHIPNLEDELSRFSTENIGTVAFDARLGLYEDPPPQEALKFIDAARDFFAYSNTLVFSIPSNMVRRYIDTPTLKKFFKASDDIIEIGQGFVDKKMKEIKEMAEKDIEASGGTQEVSLLTYLLTKEDLTPEEVNGHAIDVVLGGVDTTANTLLWLLYHVARLPHIQEKIYQEVKEVVGQEEHITAKHVGKLSYLKACSKESARMTPVVPVTSRILDQDIVLSGYNVPAQTPVILEHYCTSLSEKYFKDPLEFKPERWLRESRDENHAFKSLPFGFGARMCVGRRVAELEIYMFLCKLLQRFRIEYEGEPLELYQRLICVPDKPVKIKLVDRL